MDIRIKKYIQYKVRTLEERRQELVKLKAKREELRREIMDASPETPDGQPRGKGGTGDPTQRKALKLIEIDRRIGVLDGELKRFVDIEQNIRLMR